MSADGTRARLLARAQADADAARELDWLVAVDSTVVRVHQHGATARWVGGNAVTAPVHAQQDAAADAHRAGEWLPRVSGGKRGGRPRCGVPPAGCG